MSAQQFALRHLAATVFLGLALVGFVHAASPLPASPPVLLGLFLMPSTSDIEPRDDPVLQSRSAGLRPERSSRSLQSLQMVLARQGLPELIATLRVRPRGTSTEVVETPVVQFEQVIDGLPVFGAHVAVLLDTAQRPRAVSGGISVQADSKGRFQLTEREALRAVLASRFGLEPARPSLERAQADRDFRSYNVTGTGDFVATTPVRTTRLWYPLAERLVPAYQLTLTGSRAGASRPIGENIIVSAEDGMILRRHNLIRDLRPPRPSRGCGQTCGESVFRYRVLTTINRWPLVDPFGDTVPHPDGVADGWLPQQPATMRLVRMRHSGISTDDPWLADEVTQTLGNNVDAFFNGLASSDNGEDGGEVYNMDVFASWGPEFGTEYGDFRAPVSSPRTFDYAYDVQLAPDDYFQLPGEPVQPVPDESTQLHAKIVQGFFLGNWLHDLFYDLGFDEAAGNMQRDNYGRGGLENDPLIVHAGYSVTFAYTPEDGTSPAVTAGHNAYSLSNRDISGLDVGVFVHEWSHIMFSRLTQMRYAGQQGAINEGTADFIGVFLMVEADDRDAAPETGAFHGAYPIGAYWNLDYYDPAYDLPPAGSEQRPDNTYYHGIRRFPYSASLEINPLTFGHISPDNPLPPGFEPFDWKSRSYTSYEIHTAGEVWGSALWQCAMQILAQTPPRRIEMAKRRVLGHLVAGLKMLPTDATFTEARDAVLLAARAASESDYQACRTGFALRGLGAGAESPPRYSEQLRGVTESFEDADPF